MRSRAENTGMNDKRKTALKRISIVVVVLVAWVSIAIVLTFGVSPSGTSSGQRAAPAVSKSPAVPEFIFTQFIAGGPMTVATQAPDGSLVVVTQYPVQSLTFSSPGV